VCLDAVGVLDDPSMINLLALGAGESQMREDVGVCRNKDVGVRWV
jgi:hypothetical protein